MQSYQRFQCIGHTDFGVSGTNGPRSLSRVKTGTHSAFREESHTAAHTAKHGPSLPRPQHGLVLPAKSPPEEQPEEADARLWRVSASSGVAAPLGCVIFSVSVEIAACTPCAQGLSVCARRGVVYYPQRALRAAETPDGRLSKRLICRFLRSGGRSSSHDSYFLANTQNFLLAVPVANAFALWYHRLTRADTVLAGRNVPILRQAP